MKKMETLGYRAFVLNYRCTSKNPHPVPQMDLALGIKYLRSNAKNLCIDPKDVMLVGFSAGGHLCASETLYAEEYEQILMEELYADYPVLAEKYKGIPVKADKICLSYPVINFMTDYHEESCMNLTAGNRELRKKLSVDQHVDSSYPRTFVWVCEDDESVPPSNAKRMADALKRKGVECQLNVYPDGGHGCDIGVGTSAEGWIDEMVKFMQQTHGNT